jgi:hypothetical protein
MRVTPLCLWGVYTRLDGPHITPRPRPLFRGSELDFELIQTNVMQKPMLRIEVGAVSCSRCACVAHAGLARENRGAWASAACKALGCACPCLRLRFTCNRSGVAIPGGLLIILTPLAFIVLLLFFGQGDYMSRIERHECFGGG